MICPAPCRMPHPLLYADTPPDPQTRFTSANHGAVQTGFTQRQTRFEPTPEDTGSKPTSQLCAVCLAACKYQHRKWCHSGDTVNPVWTPASRWKLDPKWLLVVTVCTCVSCVLDLQAQLSVTFLLLLSDQSANKHPSERFMRYKVSLGLACVSLC